MTKAARGDAPRTVSIQSTRRVSAETLQPLDEVDGEVLIAVAARVGSVRLSDNAIFAFERWSAECK